MRSEKTIKGKNMKEIEKAYNPKGVEDKIYKKWEESGFFNPDNLKGKPYSIMMPPPNVTGVLHLGHALENSLMDVIGRYQRLRSKKIILGQIKKMGTSCDWSRLAYSFDEDRNKAVNEIFKKMYEDGLIYRGFRAVNWSTKGQSTLSDDEIVHIPRKAKLYTFKYSKDFPITIATTRPETKLGDTAVAVNPKDPRYKKYIGKTIAVNFVGVPLFIKIIVEKLKEQGLLEKEEEIDQNISVSQRTGAIIEPLPKLQWFIDVNKPFLVKGDGIKSKEFSR